jgi:hypothetical protein
LQNKERAPTARAPAPAKLGNARANRSGRRATRPWAAAGKSLMTPDNPIVDGPAKQRKKYRSEDRLIA